MAPGAGVIDWGVAVIPRPGETVSGDQYFVASLPDGALVAAVDGLGHGPAARHAAILATATLERHAQEPVPALIQRCHERLSRTRGAAISLARFDTQESTMTWVGVGNVDGVLLRTDLGRGARQEWLLVRPGVVGYYLPLVQPATLPVRPGDILCFATDGIHNSFAEALTTHGSPQEIADYILRQYGKGTDDALVLVARYLAGKV